MDPHIPLPTPETGPSGQGDLPWCCRCGTNEYLNYEAVVAVPDHFDMVDVSYVCAKCESYYGHLVPKTAMDSDVLTSFGIPSINTAMAGYLHCGDVMTPTGERMPPRHARLGPHHESWQPPRSAPMQVVRCRCGFQMEVPLRARSRRPR